MARIRRFVVGFALLLAVLLPVWFLVGALGVKFGLFDYRFGLATMISGLGPKLIYLTLAVAAAAVVLSLAARPRRGLVVALVALAVPVAALGYSSYLRSQSKGYPPIHEAMTDAADPPAFSPALLKVREDSKSNPVLPPGLAMKERPVFKRIMAVRPELMAPLADKTVGDLVAAGFPDLRPIELSVAPARAFELAQQEARAQGWTIHSADAQAGRIDATAETFWFGFKDDVAIRVRPGAAPGSSVVDLRSISRVGGGDMGANGKRIRAFSEGLRGRAPTA